MLAIKDPEVGDVNLKVGGLIRRLLRKTHKKVIII
jgi:hypothetical protein